MTTNSEIERDPFQEIKGCLLMENDDEALPCLEELIRNWPAEDSCKPSMVLLTRDGCVPCEEEHQHHAAAIEAGIIEVVDINSPRGADIAEKNGIEWTPAVLIVDCENKVIGEESAPEESTQTASV